MAASSDDLEPELGTAPMPTLSVVPARRRNNGLLVSKTPTFFFLKGKQKKR